MARPNKYNLKYFPLDVDFFEDDKIVMIEEDFGIKGGYIALRLLAMVYEHGYHKVWGPTSQFTIAKRVGKGITGALVMEILRSCLKHGLFSQKLFDVHAVLTSKGIQKQWLLVMQQMRRKVEVSSEYWLVSSEEKLVTSEVTHPPETFSTQKEIKVNEIKVKKIVASAKPPPPQKLVDKKKEDTEPYWQDLVEVWHKFGIEKFGEKPSFKDRDPAVFKNIIQQLKKRASEKNVEWNEKNSPRYLRIFLEKAYSEKWLSSHFLLKNLNEQFDMIAQNQSSKKTNSPPVTDLQYLFERYLEGDLDKRYIVPDHFKEISKKYQVGITAETINKRMSQLIGGNESSDMQLYEDYRDQRETKLVVADKLKLMRLVVLELFEKLKREKLATI